MKISVKQLNRLIMKTIKEQATAGATVAPVAATPDQASAINTVLQNIMNYAAQIYGGRRGYIPSLTTRNRRQIDSMEREILNVGNIAATGLDTLSSIPEAARVIPQVRTAIQSVQQELRTMQTETRGADLASFDLVAFGNRLRTLREQIIRNAYSPLVMVRRRLGISGPAGAERAAATPAPDARTYISSFGSGLASAFAPPASSTPSSETSSVATAPSGATRPTGEERVRAATTGLGTLSPTSEPGLVAEPTVTDTGPVPVRGTRPLEEAALRRFIKQEVKKYLR